MQTTRNILAVALVLAAVPLAAQGRKSSLNVPPGQLPPRGMCRVWIQGVPPGQQPPVTDCATAQLNRPANSTIIYGDQSSFPGRRKNNIRTGTANGDVVSRSCVNRSAVVVNGVIVPVCTDANGNVIRSRRGERDDDEDDDRRGIGRREHDEDNEIENENGNHGRKDALKHGRKHGHKGD